MELSDEDANYRAICSRVTLQSKKEGFFKQLADSLAPKVNFGVFILCSTDIERFKTVAAACWDDIKPELIFRGKNPEVSAQKRVEGNKHFEKNEYRKALLCYCQSLVQAPLGPELISAYSNRSALLFKIGEYQSAIDDAELAISYGSPEETKHKLYERMTSCYISLKNYQKAKVTARLAKHLAEKHDPKNDKLLKKLEKHGAAIEAGLKDNKASSTATQKSADDDALQLPEGIRITSPSPVFSRASRKMTVEFNEKQGRFAKATEKISAGEVVLCEEPYASCVNLEKMGSHCCHCLIRTKIPIPCETCSHIVFCSRKCRKEAMDTYHRFECKVQALLMGSGMSPGAYLALRMITQGTVDQFKEMFMDVELDPTRVILDPDTGKYDHRSYFNIFNLGGLEDYRTHIDMYERTLMAVFLIKCLRLNDYFQINLFKNPKPTEDELMIGSLILRNLQVVQFNAYEVCEFLMESRNVYRKATTSGIGLGIYTTASYFNHACAPDVTRYFYGRNMIVQAIQGVGRDQPIYDNYGPHFTKVERKDRIRNLLGRYWFKCECIACEKNYPLLIQFPVEIVQTENDLEERKALKKLINLDKVYFDEGLKAMESGKPRVAIELYRKYIEEYEALTVLQEGKFANNPYKTVLLVQEGLKLSLCSLGSTYVADEDK